MAHIIIVKVKQPSIRGIAEWADDFREWSNIDPNIGEEGMFHENNNWIYTFTISDDSNMPRDYGSSASARSTADAITKRYPGKVFAMAVEKHYPMGEGPGWRSLDEPMPSSGLLLHSGVTPSDEPIPEQEDTASFMRGFLDRKDVTEERRRALEPEQEDMPTYLRRIAREKNR